MHERYRQTTDRWQTDDRQTGDSSRSLKKLEAKDVLRNIYRAQAAEGAEKCRLLSLVTLTLDLWPWPSNSSERGTNTSFAWIWHKSVQLFPRYFIHKQKTTDWRRQKETFAVHLRAVIKFIYLLLRQMAARHTVIQNSNIHTTQLYKN